MWKPIARPNLSFLATNWRQATMKAVCIAMLFPHFERLRFDRSAINQSCASFATLMLTGGDQMEPSLQNVLSFPAMQPSMSVWYTWILSILCFYSWHLCSDPMKIHVFPPVQAFGFPMSIHITHHILHFSREAWGVSTLRTLCLPGVSKTFRQPVFLPQQKLAPWGLSVDICWYITFAPSRFGKSTPGAYALTYLRRYDNWDDCHHVRLKIWCVHSSSLPFRTSYYDVLTVETYKSPRVLLRKLA